MEVRGVRSSWETLAMKSRRVFSTRSVSVRSRSTATAPPPGKGGGHVEGAAGNDGSGARGLDLVGGRGFLDAGEEIRIADGFDDGLLQPGTLRNQTIHGAVGPLHQAIVADGDDGVLHAVEQGFELALAGDDSGEAVFNAAGSFVDGSGDAADFVLRMFEDARLKIAIGDASGNVDDALETAGRPLGGDGRHEKREQKCQAGSQLQPAADLQGDCVDIGKRISQADGAAGDGLGNVKKRNPEGSTAALIAADLAGKSRNELRRLGGALHVSGTGFRIGQHIACGVDNSDASPGGLSFLSSDIGEDGRCDRFRPGEPEVASS